MSWRYAESRKPSIKKLKESAGEIPSETCPDIDKVIEMLGEEKIDVDVVITKLEELRKANGKLRDLGRFWYEQCDEAIEFYEGYVDERLEEQKADLEYEHEQALISLEKQLSN